MLLFNGTTNQDDGSFTVFGPAVGVTQYDPNLCDGVCSIVKIGGDLELNSFIWDRADDNKLYARFNGLEGPADPNKYFSINQQLLFFETNPASWPTVASELMAINAPCPNTDIASMYGDVRDCRVDFFDFTVLAQHWLDSGNGDLDSSGLVDYSDLAMLTSCWLDYNLDPQETCW